jgi:hypothetical protein
VVALKHLLIIWSLSIKHKSESWWICWNWKTASTY